MLIFFVFAHVYHIHLDNYNPDLVFRLCVRVGDKVKVRFRL